MELTTGATPPMNPATGDMWTNTVTGETRMWDGSAWVSAKWAHIKLPHVFDRHEEIDAIILVSRTNGAALYTKSSIDQPMMNLMFGPSSKITYVRGMSDSAYKDLIRTVVQNFRTQNKLSSSEVGVKRFRDRALAFQKRALRLVEFNIQNPKDAVFTTGHVVGFGYSLALVFFNEPTGDA